MSMKNYLMWGLVLIVVIGGGYFVYKGMGPGVPAGQDPRSAEPAATTTNNPATSERQEQIGTSTEGRAITAYHFGQGDTEILFVGGIHGGYSWNTSLVAYELIDYLDKNPGAVSMSERVTVLPVLNPDGLYRVVGTTGRFAAADVSATAAQEAAGRFNASAVDLNRNFDCDWKSTGVWQNKTVSGGSAPFSEPESRAMEAYITKHDPDAVVVWYSAAGGVFASNCHNGILQETSVLARLYADASGYKEYQSFDFYAINGDMVNWLAKEGIPAISVLLTTHHEVEWDKNRAGIDAVLKHYAQ